MLVSCIDHLILILFFTFLWCGKVLLYNPRASNSARLYTASYRYVGIKRSSYQPAPLLGTLSRFNGDGRREWLEQTPNSSA